MEQGIGNFGMCEIRLCGMGRTGGEQKRKIICYWLLYRVAVQSSASFLAASWKALKG